jgi:hypothetical protein
MDFCPSVFPPTPEELMSAVLKTLVQPTNHLLEKLSLRSKLLGIFFILLVPLIILTITLFEKIRMI